MIKLFDVVNYKTNVKGYWLDNGKIYIDNVNIKEFSKENYAFIISKRKLFRIKKQLAVFYIKNNIAYIEDCKGNITILKNKIAWNEKRITKEYLKILLLQHKGLTIYKNDNDYTIEIWKE